MVRFDFQTLSYLTALPTIAYLLATFVKRDSSIKASVRAYYTVAYSLLTGLILADISFYKNFSDHFNITVFDFFNEEPLTLIQTFWEEYPVIWMLLGLIILGYAIYHINPRYTPQKRSYSLAIVWIALIIVMMRGSVTEFPLQVEDMYVSPSKELNDCIPNAAYAMKKAWSEKKKSFTIESKETLLSKFGFTSVDEAWNAYGSDEHDIFTTVKDSILTSHESRQPDIVVILSESWSGYLTQMALDRKDEKLLCGMRPHLSEDLLFLNYQSVHNGTIATLENLLINTSYPRVFMSKYRYAKFPTSFAEPFKKSGYETIFMSGMDEGWENIGIGLETLGYRKIFKYELLKSHPEYEYNSVGIYDHHLMQSLYEELGKTSSKPRLFIVMTTTNHPPFVYPESAHFPTLPDTFYDTPLFDNAKDVQQKYIRGYQYANASMSGFLDRFKASSKADNTIVMITGDHNVRTALRYATDGVPEEWHHRVPLYMYIPKAYRGTEDGSYHCDTSKWGCHYDILTTLARFAFKPGTRYLNIGQDLLSDSLNSHNTISYNTESLLYDRSNKYLERKAQARELLLRLYLQEFISSVK